MRNTVAYEWVIEELEPLQPGEALGDPDRDILDLCHSDTLEWYGKTLVMALQDPDNFDLALQRMEGNDADGMTDRVYAYFHNGELEPVFQDCSHKVPQRFHKELAAFIKKHGVKVVTNSQRTRPNRGAPADER